MLLFATMLYIGHYFYVKLFFTDLPSNLTNHSLSLPILLVLFWVKFAHVFYMFFLYLYSLMVIFTLGCMHFHVLTVLLRLLETFVQQKFSFSSTFKKRQQTFSCFHIHFVAILKLFTIFNHLYGEVFTLYLLFYCPVHVTFVVHLLFSWTNYSTATGTPKLKRQMNSSTLIGNLYMSLYAAFQLIGLFGLHYCLAGLSEILLRPLKRLHQLKGAPRVVIYRREKAFGLKLRMSFFLQHFLGFGQRKLGVTYGPFGLVTMRSFVMVIV